MVPWGMFRIRLVLVQAPGRLVFRVGNSFRVVNLVAAAALLAAGFALDAVLVATVLASVAVLGALYEESARFDQAANRAEFRLGLVIFHRTKAFRLDQIGEVRVSTFGPAQFTGLEVGLQDGTTLTIENDRGKASTDRLTRWGAELAQWLGVPLVH